MDLYLEHFNKVYHPFISLLSLVPTDFSLTRFDREIRFVNTFACNISVILHCYAMNSYGNDDK